MPISTKVPGSQSRSIRSRAVSLPRSCWTAIFSSPPPSFAFSLRACRSSVSPFIPVCSPPSAPLPLRFALLEERRDALLDVLGREGQGELGAEELERVIEPHVLLAVHRVVPEPHQHRALRGELGGPLVDRRVEFPRGDNLVRQPVGDRVLRAHLLT